MLFFFFHRVSKKNDLHLLKMEVCFLCSCVLCNLVYSWPCNSWPWLCWNTEALEKLLGNLKFSRNLEAGILNRRSRWFLGTSLDLYLLSCGDVHCTQVCIFTAYRAPEKHLENMDSVDSSLLTSSEQVSGSPHDSLTSSTTSAQMASSFKEAVKWRLIFNLTNIIISTTKLVILEISHQRLFHGECINYLFIWKEQLKGVPESQSLDAWLWAQLL